MPLENANYISELVLSNPADGDTASQGDDHIRTLKKAVQQSFPNVSGAVNLSHTQLNALPQDITDAVDTLRTELLPHLVPAGTIVVWSGSVASIPSGWALCDGSNGTEDLRERFIIGAGGSYPVNVSGGSASVATGSAGEHNHGGATSPHALTTAQMPAHSHEFRLTKSVVADDATGGASREILTANRNYASDNLRPTVNIANTGSGSGHSHNIGDSGAHTHTVATLPPYYAKAFIQKVSTIS